MPHKLYYCLMINGKAPRYLEAGNARQQLAFEVLQVLRLWARLADFDPVLAGTIPLAIDTPESDLDVLCEVVLAEQPHFCQLLKSYYGHLPDFRLRRAVVGDEDSIISNFRYEGFEIEVFDQAIPTSQQLGFRHLLIDHVLLQAGREAWRRAVQQLKERVPKTEPAFALLLQLSGNPYETLLTLEGKPPAELRAYLSQVPLPKADNTTN
ncbi:DUF4269 domain-containing protein [Hymenobacter sp. B81]|uniref:DUF4269 domain-containing protein n=1 Tax=Hymenobacter sp. B81 TaxID=3344878 RepID=UPI0037DD4165